MAGVPRVCLAYCACLAEAERLRRPHNHNATGRLKLNEKLGYPDFEPATNDADEDQLTDQRLRTGWVYNEQKAAGGKDVSFSAFVACLVLADECSLCRTGVLSSIQCADVGAEEGNKCFGVDVMMCVWRVRTLMCVCVCVCVFNEHTHKGPSHMHGRPYMHTNMRHTHTHAGGWTRAE